MPSRPIASAKAPSPSRRSPEPIHKGARKGAPASSRSRGPSSKGAPASRRSRGPSSKERRLPAGPAAHPQRSAGFQPVPQPIHTPAGRRCSHRRSLAQAAPGWTLVEVLVVVAILGALAAIALSLIPAGKIRAQQVASTANLRSLCAANLAYVVDHGTYCPASSPDNLVRWHGARTSRKGRFDPTKGYLSDYLGKSRSVIACPRFTNMVEEGSWELGSGGYGYNATYIGGTPSHPFHPAKPSEVAHPSRTIMFATTALAKGSGLQEYPFAEPPRWVDPNWRLRGPLQPSVHFRFLGRALIGWCDGHVTAELPSEFPATNFYGGDNKANQIGIPGPRENNGWFNSRQK